MGPSNFSYNKGNQTDVPYFGGKYQFWYIKILSLPV